MLCTAQSLSLARSPPVTDLVHHAGSTLLALVHVLQMPAVDKVRAQLEAYFSYVLGQPLTASAAAPSLALGQSAACSGDSQRCLSECVQLLLLIEALSLPVLISSPSHYGCQCPTNSAPVQRQRFLSPNEARALWSLARQQDTELLLLHRFSSELQRQDDSSDPPFSFDCGSQTTPMAHPFEGRIRSLSLDGQQDESSPADERSDKSQRRSHSASEMLQRDSAHCEWGRPVDYSRRSSGSSGNSGAVLDSAAEGSPQARERPMPSAGSLSINGPRQQSSASGSATLSTASTSTPPSSLYAHPRQRGPSFAHVHRAVHAPDCRRRPRQMPRRGRCSAT